MTVAQRERSRQGGAPIDLVEFTSGEQSWRLAADVEQHVHLGVYFDPTPLTVGPSRQTDEIDAGSVEVRVPRDHALADVLLSAFLYEPVAVRIFRRHRDTRADPPTLLVQQFNPDQEPPTERPFMGQVGQTTVDGVELVIPCQPLQALLSRQIPRRVVSRLCPHMQYGIGCGLDVNDFTEEHEVTVLSSDERTLTIPTLFAGAWVDLTTLFAGGVVLFNGRARMISVQDTTELRLLAPFPDLAVGGLVQIAPSCGLEIDRCRDEFDNLRMFGGFPAMPEKNPFGGHRLI